ncbi:hypothetical protein Caci_8218 [Catenulispora acidiphila DSM 44928]|uniref:Uncharacterized protein n=1 Tax=Catenulispora acidiphila (strain DSM 44928 / JCM 14897 / NBRC 102108 / NRRL B-24433 / ID139908) TaxID=479433 RepID=C7QIZ1_CATAD|nr:hypothetical protein [Catenulispora acidiphila]ACU77041.1 hypothetical protein Caci_8218 [Catenulispora acidiphila DSM 44928]
MTENSDLLVHDMIGRLFEEPEPMHRTDLADGAIAQGMAVTRRRGFAVAGATLSVLAVVAGATALAGGGTASGGGDWSIATGTGNISPQAYEDSAPTYSDRQREIAAELPGTIGPLLPQGVKVVPDRMSAGGDTSMLTGDYGQGVEVSSGGKNFAVRFDPTDATGYADAFARVSATPVAVAGGVIRVAVVPQGTESSFANGFTAWYEFKPTDAVKAPFRFYIYGDGQNTPIDATAFQKMIEAPGFGKLQHLLDPSVPASSAAVRLRYSIEAKINTEAKTILPAGFRLKLSPGAPGALELVGPDGVDTLEWFAIAGAHDQISCPAGSLCYTAHSGAQFKQVGPDGKARLGAYAGWTGTSKDSSIVLNVFGKPETGTSVEPAQLGKPVETAPQGSGLTPQQARAIIQAPGASKVITDVQRLVSMADLQQPS